jgi:dTDP-4-amino-4,6-dideoxygalactose transaminase
MIKLSDFDYEKKLSLDQLCGGTMSRQDFILGQSVQDFESAFALYTQATHCITTGNCTDSLRLCLQSLGVGPGTNVITVGLTWISTYEVVANLGAEIRLVDVDEYLTMDMDQVNNLVDKQPRAIIGVELFGQSCDWDRLTVKLPTISDAAQATGGSYKKRPIGTVTDYTCFSFYPTKNLGCLGDGGAITTNLPPDQLRQLRNHGQRTKFDVAYVGWNSRLDSLQAEILLNKLPHLDQWNQRRIAISDFYDEQFKNLFDIVPVRPNSVNVRHQYAVLTDRKQQLQSALKNANIESRCYYENLGYQQPIYGVKSQLPRTENISQTNIAIPTHQFVTDKQVAMVADIVKKVLL